MKPLAIAHRGVNEVHAAALVRPHGRRRPGAPYADTLAALVFLRSSNPLRSGTTNARSYSEFGRFLANSRLRIRRAGLLPTISPER